MKTGDCWIINFLAGVQIMGVMEGQWGIDSFTGGKRDVRDLLTYSPFWV
jgi:hypothetical protein